MASCGRAIKRWMASRQLSASTRYLALSATDADSSDTLSFSVDNLPDGLDIDPSTGIISGTVFEDALQAIPYSITVTVDDGLRMLRFRSAHEGTAFVWQWAVSAAELHALLAAAENSRVLATT